MNYFTEQSVELANQRDYLDQLFRVYPLSPDSIREIDENVWNAIERSYEQQDNSTLLKSLLKLDLFPIKDGYVPYFRKDASAIDRNPNTVNRICGRIRELGLEKLYEKCTAPKETNRQMGPLFRRWLRSGALGVFPIAESQFVQNSDNAILDGSDEQLKEFAIRELGYTRNLGTQEEKGLDFIGRFNGKYVIGEAKFISCDGGHQNDQFLDAITTLRATANENVIKIAILDGVLYIRSRSKMHNDIVNQDVNVMSALLLRDFLYSL